MTLWNPRWSKQKRWEITRQKLLEALWHKQCDRKIPYQTQSQAECDLKNLMQSRHYDGKPLCVYPCWNHFHIGHVKESCEPTTTKTYVFANNQTEE